MASRCLQGEALQAQIGLMAHMNIFCENDSQQVASATSAGLQGFKLPASLRATTDLLKVVAHADLLLLCVPTPYVAATLEKICDHLRPQQARAGHI